MLSKSCLVCGKIFIKKSSEGKPYWATKKYCSNRCANQVKRPIWNKGLKGIHLSPKSEFPKGFLPPTHWKKGHKTWNKTYLRELRYLIRECVENMEWRKAVFARDKYICQECGKKGYLHAHHKKPFSLIIKEFVQEYPQFSPIDDKETLVRLSFSYKPFWDLNNGITLCRDCHEKYRYESRKKAEGSHL